MMQQRDADGVVVYEVNLAIDSDVAEAFAAWLAPHIEEMLQLEGFDSATWFELEGGAQGGRVAWRVQYTVKDRATLQRYFDVDAPRMRGDGIKRFSGRFDATRHILRIHPHTVAARGAKKA